MVMPDRCRRQPTLDQPAIVRVEPRGCELAKLDGAKLGLGLLGQQAVTRDRLRRESPGFRMVEEGVEQLAHRSLRRAPQVLGRLRRELRSCLVGDPPRSAHALAELAVPPGPRVSPRGNGHFPNARSQLPYPCHAQTRSALWNKLWDDGLAER
jgi:hypothetical protein